MIFLHEMKDYSNVRLNDGEQEQLLIRIILNKERLDAGAQPIKRSFEFLGGAFPRGDFPVERGASGIGQGERGKLVCSPLGTMLWGQGIVSGFAPNFRP